MPERHTGPGPTATTSSRQTPRSLLGFDYGQQRIGIASGQRWSGTATPLTTLPARNGQPDWNAVARLIEEWRPDALVVGEPLALDGSETGLTRAAQRFARRLEGRFGLPVFMMDERLSSREAEGRIRQARGQGGRRKTNREEVDRLAAQIILQNWLDQQGKRNE